MAAGGSQSKKMRKVDRNRKRGGGGQNARYLAEHRHHKSHVRRITKHLKRYDKNKNDIVAQAALQEHKVQAGIYR
jgi:hypothetical protein